VIAKFSVVYSDSLQIMYILMRNMLSKLISDSCMINWTCRIQIRLSCKRIFLCILILYKSTYWHPIHC
jgi:hypothetical protein